MELIEAISKLTGTSIENVILSDPKIKTEDAYQKARIRPVLIRKLPHFQIERFTKKQSFQQNVLPEELREVLLSELTDHFAQLDARTNEGTVLIRVSKKGKVLYRAKRKAGDDIKKDPTEKEGFEDRALFAEQNRPKKYLLDAKDAPRPLVDLGVVSREGKVIASQYDKYRQINRFVETIDQGITEDITSLNVIDFGCGKSYLTFVLYDYLTRVRGITTHMVGLDLKADVIEKCNRIAKSYAYDDLHFEVGDIHGYHPDFEVDMVISLHACDTATDFALFNAISWGTKRIYSVPCCQHEINRQLKKKSAGCLSQQGLIKERFAALLTDAIRQDLLRAKGYKVDVLEFVSMEHSPKNLLIRAIRTNTDEKTKKEAQNRVEETLTMYGIDQTLYSMLTMSERMSHKKSEVGRVMID